MKKKVFWLTIALITFLMPTLGLTHEFINPPELNPAVGWQGTFPYQRNIYWDFVVNPVGGPSPQGTPGAIYEGWADPSLMVSDYVEFHTEPYQLVWDITNEPEGKIGFGGGAQASGDVYATFHLDNFNLPNPIKNLYLETVVSTVSGDDPWANWGPPYLNLPLGFQGGNYAGYSAQLLSQNPEVSYFLIDMWFNIDPNPLWEDVILPFYLNENSMVWISDLHIATECVPRVPEPATVLLLGLGLMGITGIRRKFKI